MVLILPQCFPHERLEFVGRQGVAYVISLNVIALMGV